MISFQGANLNNRSNLLIVLGSVPFTVQTLFAQRATKVWLIGYLRRARLLCDIP
jgi:hypothetical protein